MKEERDQNSPVNTTGPLTDFDLNTRPEFQHRPQKGQKSYLWLSLIVIVVIVLVIVLISSGGSTSNNKIATTNNYTITQTSKNIKIDITPTGFVPATLTVQAGTTITWTNDTTSDVLIASGPYPMNNSYSELKSKELGTGASYTFKATDTGNFTYQNNLKPTESGSLTVK